MSRRIDRYNRLESRPNDRDLQNGFAARLHDPLWLLARQWEMGEHQGENAASPVRVDCTLTRTALRPLGNDPAFDPAVVPAEALVESEPDDWWSMGRRIRAGQRFAATPAIANRAEFRFADPPPPYDRFRGHLDGRAIWLARADPTITEDDFGEDRPPPDSPAAWSPAKLNYSTTFASDERALSVIDHHGGPMDWYSADAETGAPLGEPAPVPLRPRIPVPLEYPGAPHSRFWEIEDAKVDIGGYPPDAAHLATMLLVDLVYSHGDDWFVFPVSGRVGQLLTLRTLTVTDSFGRAYSSDTHGGLRAPGDFSIFKCDGLHDETLVLWPVAESPLESEPLERVQFGVDEHSNALWALERIVDRREVVRGPTDADDAHPAHAAPVPLTDLQGPREYAYAPAAGMESGWHPYLLDWSTQDAPAYVQWGLADYALQVPRPMRHPDAAVLQGDPPGTIHRIAASAMAQGGIELERRWQLARDVAGRPVLWIQRQRRALRNPPARTTRLDVMTETARPADV